MGPSFAGERKTTAIIDLEAIRYNVAGIKKRVGNRVKICPAVKADAYGHGAVEVSNMLEKSNLADFFGVATIEEGIELRKAGITLPILLFGITFSDEMEKALAADLTLSVCTEEHVIAAAKAAQRLGKRPCVHIKTDTGMGRIGCRPDEVVPLAKKIKSIPNLVLEGLFTHFPTSDETDKTVSNIQIDLFNGIIGALKMEEITVPIKHMANSGAILDLPTSFFDMVRPGMMMYGHYPSPETTESIPLKPAMKLRSEIAFVKRVTQGTPISYGQTYKASRDAYVASVPAGYADGLNRRLSNKHMVIINGKQYKIAGRICMDQFMVDLGDDVYPVGTEVVMFGFDTITASDVARELETIPYEVTCWVSRRVKRYYL